MLKRAFVLFWYVIYIVKSDGEYMFEKPTPVLRSPPQIQSTDVFNPLKYNKDSNPKSSTTVNIEAGSLIPTAVLDKYQSTDIAKPRKVIETIVSEQLSTTNALPNIDSLVSPTSVANVVRQETAAANPILLNMLSVTPQSTGIFGNDVVKPTPVIISIESKPAAVALINDEPESPITTNFNPIQPSQIFINDPVESTTKLYTPNLNTQEPNVAPVSETISSTTESGLMPCKCYNYDKKPTAALDPASHGPGIAFLPPFLIAEAPKYDLRDGLRPPNGIFQHINFQLNLFLNNLPLLTANVYEQP